MKENKMIDPEITPEMEQAMSEYGSMMCVPYVLGYMEGLKLSGHLRTCDWKDYRSQYETGLGNAMRDCSVGVVAVQDTDLSKHLQTLIQGNKFPLDAKTS